MEPSVILATGFVIVLSFFFLVPLLMVRKNRILEFFINEYGNISLSRFQAVLWAIVIISFQVSLIIFLRYYCIDSVGKSINCFVFYDLVLPEEMLFLLGISFASFITVAGIQKNKEISEIKKKGKISDLITNNENKLDFSRFQMLGWTVIAVIVYQMNCGGYLSCLFEKKGNLDNLFNPDNPLLPLPKISWTFIYLMGLSQALYIGKKLIPQGDNQNILQNILNCFKKSNEDLPKIPEFLKKVNVSDPEIRNNISELKSVLDKYESLKANFKSELDKIK
jgi:hypothetical protein